MRRIMIRALFAGAAITLGGLNAQAQCLIPLYQLISGGPGRNSIPPLNSPKVISVAEGNLFLAPGDLVLGVVINGEARAYPHGVLWYHEIINDFLGGIPVAVTYCPLTGSGLIYNAVVNETTIRFGTSGLLFENNLVMFDEGTNSLWSQMTVGSICGELTGVEASLFPVVQSSWAAWSALYPETTVVSFDTGFFNRNYYFYPYGNYENISGTTLLFPQSFVDPRLPVKETVLGITREGVSRAYPMSVLSGMGPRRAVNDNVNGLELLVVFDATSSLMIPYNRRLIDLAAGADAPGRLLTFDVIEEGSFPFNLTDRETGTVWSLTGIALTGELEGARLQPIATYSAFWFAWAAFNRDTEIYSPSTAASP